MSRSRALQYYIGAFAAGSPDAMDNNNARVLLRATPGDPVDAVLGNRAPIVSKRRIANGWGYQNLCRCSTSTIWDPYCGWIWEFNYRPGSRRLVSDPVFSGNRGTGSLQHGSGADYWNWRWCAFRIATRHDFRYGEGCLELLLMRFRSLGGDAHAVNFAVQLRWFPLGSRSPPRCHRPLVRRDFTQLIVCSVVI